MARRRKTTKRKTSRRRRVSGIGGGVINQIAGIAAGAVGVSIITNMALKNQSNMIKGGAAIAAGIFLPKLVKGSFGAAAASGAMAVGAVALVKEFAPNLISGIPQLGYANYQPAGEITESVAGVNAYDNEMELGAIAGFM